MPDERFRFYLDSKGWAQKRFCPRSVLVQECGWVWALGTALWFQLVGEQAGEGGERAVLSSPCESVARSPSTPAGLSLWVSLDSASMWPDGWVRFSYVGKKQTPSHPVTLLWCRQVRCLCISPAVSVRLLLFLTSHHRTPPHPEERIWLNNAHSHCYAHYLLF